MLLGTGGGRRGFGSGLGGRGGVRAGIGVTTVDEVPFTVDDAGALRGEEPEEAARKVETAVGTSRALVHDGCGGRLSTERDPDLLETVGTWVSATILLNSRGQTTEVALGKEEVRTGVFKATMKSFSVFH